MSSGPQVERATVLGAGTMGHGIAQVCAQAGIQVTLFDVDATALQRGIAGVRKSLEKLVEKGKTSRAAMDAALARLVAQQELAVACAGAELVIEAVPEKLELKRMLFDELEGHLAPDAMIASNTSSLSITKLADGLARPERFLGLHFFNPVPLMPLLEIVTGVRTAPETVVRAQEFGQRIGKESIVVRDAPGFASSRLGLALGLEAIRMLEQGVASAQDIDKAMELGYRHPMGPLKLTDLVGLDVRLGIAEYLHGSLGEGFRPPELLRRMVAEGKLGRKSGQGFYAWGE